MPNVVAKDIKMAYHNQKEVSSLRVGTSLVWEHPSLVISKTVSDTNIVVPSWAAAVSFVLIGGGGGGQTGNGSNNGSGQPGAAANWAVYYKNLERLEGESFYINISIGGGGAGGGNSDHASGSNGGATMATLMRRTSSGVVVTAGSYTASGGIAGPASRLGIGRDSTRPDIISPPRTVPHSPHVLPRGSAAGKERNGGSPGAGGGFGGGGLFGRRGRGGKGGDGQARFYFYGAP